VGWPNGHLAARPMTSCSTPSQRTIEQTPDSSMEE
jgi:hypothetical protein